MSDVNFTELELKILKVREYCELLQNKSALIELFNQNQNFENNKNLITPIFNVKYHIKDKTFDYKHKLIDLGLLTNKTKVGKKILYQRNQDKIDRISHQIIEFINFFSWQEITNENYYLKMIFILKHLSNNLYLIERLRDDIVVDRSALIKINNRNTSDFSDDIKILKKLNLVANIRDSKDGRRMSYSLNIKSFEDLKIYIGEIYFSICNM